MKLFRIMFVAVALVAFFSGTTQAAERFESRFVTIGGIVNVVTEKVSDNGSRKVVDVVEAPSAKSGIRAETKSQVVMPKATVARVAAPPVINPKAEAQAPVREMEVSVSEPKTAKSSPNAKSYYGEGNDNSREKYSAAPKVATPAPISATRSNSPTAPEVPARPVYSANTPKNLPASQAGSQYSKTSKTSPTAQVSPGQEYRPTTPAQTSAKSSNSPTAPEGKETYRYLADWDVQEITYEVDKNGKARPFKIYKRSLAETGTRYAPGYGPNSRPVRTYTERRDEHKYIELPGKPVPAGTVEHLALKSERKPSELEMKHIIGETKNQYEFFNQESGHFQTVDKPKALRVEYVDPVQKNCSIVPVMPSKELYTFTDSRRIPIKKS